ncbi:MAG: M1 family peptidase [Betaproteobacteria bacterium]|nr:MAG: M1 family peptidase [Betaproteobacteria bacterium]
MKLVRRVARLGLFAALVATGSAWCAPHLDLDVRLDPAARSLSASASITAETSDLTFYLADQFVVQSVELDGATIPTDRSSLDGLQRFRVKLPDAEQPHTVTVLYRGELQPLDTSMTHDSTLAALPAMSSEQGSFLPGSSSWHPMLETAFTYRLNTEVPDGQIAVAPGAPSDESVDDAVRRASFTMGWPVNSIDLMVGKWSIREHGINVGDARIRIRTYFGETELGLAEGYLDAVERFIRRYSTEIGPYPYTVFSVVSSPIPTGFGMPTLTYLGRQVLGYPFIRDISLGHEVLHNWWGNGVRIDPVRGNWAEGLTTFMADYAYREDESARAAARMRHGWLRDYAALPPRGEQPLSAFRTRHHTASATIGYGKAATMFYDLRARLGNDIFAKGIRTFWDKHQHARASFDDLREAFEQASGLPLVDFFNQWLDRTGAPILQVTQARMADGSKNEVELVLSQTQDSEPFDLSVPLRLLSDEGPIDARVQMSEATQKVRIPTTAIATAALVDPGFEVWRKLSPEEAPPILRDVIAAESIQAAALQESMRDAVNVMANGFSEGSVRLVESVEASDPDKPLIIAGSKSAIAAFLQGSSFASRREQINPGVLEVWIIPDTTRKVVVVAIEAGTEDDHDWSSLGQRLRHFGRYSWVSIAAGGEAARGSWKVESPRITVTR